MSLAKNLYYTASSVLPMQFLKKLSPATTLLPYHHTVSDEELLHIRHLYNYKSIRQFTIDLDYLLKHFKPVSAAEVLVAVKENNKLPRNAFLLTFDDGFKEIYHIIAPILEAKGVPAVFFINPAFIDNKELFYRSKTSLLIHQLLLNKNNSSIVALFAKALGMENAIVEKIIYTFKASKKFTNDKLDALALQIGFSFDEYLEKEKPFLTSKQVLALKERGFTIGAHSWDHPNYKDLNEDEQIVQTLRSCDFVSTHFNEQQHFFSFPYSDEGLPQSLFDRLAKEDIGLMFGIQNQKEELNNGMLHRFNAERPERSLKIHLKGLMLMMAYNYLRKNNMVIRN